MWPQRYRSSTSMSQAVCLTFTDDLTDPTDDVTASKIGLIPQAL